jgi:hypothetical protein
MTLLSTTGGWADNSYEDRVHECERCCRTVTRLGDRLCDDCEAQAMTIVRGDPLLGIAAE